MYECDDPIENYDVFVGVSSSPGSPDWHQVISNGGGVTQVEVPDLPRVPVN